MSGSMPAARRSTTRPISATPGRSSSSTCCSGCCATSTGRRTSPTRATSRTSTTRSTPARPSAASRIRELTDGTLAQFHRDVRDLGVLMPEDVNVAGERPPLRRAPRHRPHRRDGGDDRGAGRAPATPTWRRSTSCSTSRRCPSTASSPKPPARRDGGRAPGSRSRPTSARRSTSCCGSPPSPASRPGRRPPASRRPGGRAGTSSARPCRPSISGGPSTSMRAAST